MQIHDQLPQKAVSFISVAHRLRILYMPLASSGKQDGVALLKTPVQLYDIHSAIGLNQSSQELSYNYLTIFDLMYLNQFCFIQDFQKNLLIFTLR